MNLARLPERTLMSVHLVNSIPVDRDAIQETKLKWWDKLTSFATIVRLLYMADKKNYAISAAMLR